MKQRLDSHYTLPAGMKEYLSSYGWHFSKKMAEWAISKMKDRNGNSVKPKDQKDIMDSMKSYGIKTDSIEAYDAVYVEAMLRSDFYGSAIEDDYHLLKAIEDYLCDKDGYDGIALTRFHADCIGKGMPIYWEEML